MMSDGKIRVIVKRPDEQYGHVTYMSNTLRAFQKAVDGPIETVKVFDGALAIVNEEGKIRGLERNFRMGSALFGDTIAGTAVIVGVQGEDFADCPISFDLWKRLIERWAK